MIQLLILGVLIFIALTVYNGFKETVGTLEDILDKQ
jgi:hypothetical protein|tara:strand:+ start:1314 stop:1421 length:108 start_codon:yes stop_codon:yes gene_type:complete